MKALISISIFIFMIIGIFFIFKSQIFHSIFTSTTPTKTQIAKGDFNHDGVIDYLDEVMVKDNLNCKSTDICWKKEAGKTKDGDNPIYVSTLDLNNDEIITQQDMPTGY